jgi:hypothetical protein
VRLVSTTEPFVTTERVADFIGKPQSWIHNNAGRVGLPRYRVGKQYRYRLSEVATWV